MNIGFTIGKFAPLHKGHEELIKKGIAENDEFYILINDTNVTNIPLETRAKWLKELFPKAHIILGKNPPKQYGLDEKSVEIQMEYLTKIIDKYQVTHFYSSEPYGEKVAKYLNIADRRIDNQRINYPISGTNIRKEIEKYKNSLPEIVYKDCIKYEK